MCTVRRGTHRESEDFPLLCPESMSKKEEPELVWSYQTTSPEDRQEAEGAEAEAPERDIRVISVCRKNKMQSWKSLTTFLVSFKFFKI